MTRQKKEHEKEKDRRDEAALEADERVSPASDEAATESELQDLKDQHLRLRADFDNFRRRTERERIEFSQRATETVMEDMLPVLDHFEIGLKTAREHHAENTIIDGFQLVYDQLMSVLRKAGLEPIDAKGEEFNPHLHEAVTHLPSEEHPADTVIEQTRRGYKLGDKLLRAPQVVVSSGPTGGGEEA